MKKSKQKNTYFQNHTEDYAEQIMATQPVFYANAGRLLNEQLHEGDVVLDIGNGGVINYDHRRLSRLDCADLAVSETAVRKYSDEQHIHFLQADVLSLDKFPSNQYEAVIIQTVIHHLAGPSFAQTRERVNTAISECLRVLKPGGRLLVMESTVTGWFEKMERLLYYPMQVFFFICRFGRVYQFSSASLYALLSQIKDARLLSSQPVDIGPHVWIMGKRIPTRITPCGATFYVLEKD